VSRAGGDGRGTRHLFDGQLLTVAEIRERVPVLADASIRDHLRAGRNTASAMLCHVKSKPKPKAVNQFVINGRGYWSHGMAGRGS